jgi:hypothetical protein
MGIPVPIHSLIEGLDFYSIDRAQVHALAQHAVDLDLAEVVVFPDPDPFPGSGQDDPIHVRERFPERLYR